MRVHENIGRKGYTVQEISPPNDRIYSRGLVAWWLPMASKASHTGEVFNLWVHRTTYCCEGGYPISSLVHELY